MKKIIVIAMMLASANASAGFVTGYVMGSSGKAKAASDSVALFSETNDVISCRVTYEKPHLCDSVPIGPQRESKARTPTEYAGALGYKKLHRVGVMMHDGRNYIVMEVSK